MVQTLYASKLSLYDVKSRFHLQYVEDENFFTEWTENLPDLSEQEKQRLDQVKAHYMYLSERQTLEILLVRMLILSPLLELAGFYLPPFVIKDNEAIKIEEGGLIQGQINVLVLQRKFWIAIIESKLAKFNVMEALPQILTYMMAAPHPEKPVFGMITSGDHTLFVKVRRVENPQYALSDSFFLFNRGNALYNVLRILKRFGQQALVSI